MLAHLLGAKFIFSSVLRHKENSMSYSKLIVLGTLVGDIDKDMRGTDVITSFSLKVTRTNDEQETTTRYITVTAWNKTGDPLAKAKEGDVFLIEGNSLYA